jgi:predicted nucleotide-binding protein (sugar kinase/HSP70/actin superfamily)
MADDLAMKLGKKYVHNDMCFPAQINIGEMLAVLQRKECRPEEAVLILGKSHCDCRFAHYATVARKALDDAGYPDLPVVTTDSGNPAVHPEFSLSPLFELRMLWALAMTDVLEELRRKIRPYEKEKGNADKVFEVSVEALAAALEHSIRRSVKVFKRVVEDFQKIPHDRSVLKPKVFVIGEFLLNFHPASNHYIERYLEDNGMEVVLPNMLNNFEREYMLEEDQVKSYFIRYPLARVLRTRISLKLFRYVIRKIENIAVKHPLFERKPPLEQVADRAEDVIDRTYTSGEGWMIPGEILSLSEKGIHSFLILQPFGCLPNHITGRGILKKLKELKPSLQVLALDYDPDTSFANVENRLQMLIINAKEAEKKKPAGKTP